METMTEQVHNSTEQDTVEFPESVREFARQCLARPRGASYLIPVLHRLQGAVGYLRKDHLREVAEMFGLSAAKVLGVATFYHYFSLKPRGRHTVSVCLGTACHVKGAGQVLARVEQLLGITQGQTTPDRLFSIESARCVGMCAMAPVVIVDGQVYGSVKPADVARILGEHGFQGG
jgi:NADH:ubiquinone oxidoreductase subunit E